MKRYKTNFASGFSMAELLISITIAMILAVAMVPVIGVKKIKVPINRLNHGVAECYYDGSGTLQYYYATSDKNSTPIDTAKGQFGGKTRNDFINEGNCTFRAPRGNAFEIVAIGAGGNGNDVFPTLGNITVTGGPPHGYGTLQTNESFQDSLNLASIRDANDRQVNISDKIKAALDSWAADDEQSQYLYAEYQLRSPLGESGPSVCTPYTLQNPNDEAFLYDVVGEVTPNNYNKLSRYVGPRRGGNSVNGSWSNIINAYNMWQGKNWVYYHAQGVSSAPGRKTTTNVRIPLNSSSRITLTKNFQQTGVSVVTNDNNGISKTYSLSLAASAAGNGTPTLMPDPAHPGFKKYIIPQQVSLNSGCSATEELRSYMGVGIDFCTAIAPPDNNYINIAPLGGKEGNVGSLGCTSDITPAKQGEITYPGAILWYYFVANMRVNSFYSSGTQGDVKSIMYENLTGEFNLHPAKNIEESSYANKRESNARIIVANSGKNAELRSGQILLNKTDLPFVKDFYNTVAVKNRETSDYIQYLAKINSTGFNGGLSNCGDNLCPGFAGSSPYLYITQLPITESILLYNTLNNKYYTYNGEGVPENQAEHLCLDGSQPEPSSNANVMICKTTKTTGNPGAVIILW